MVWEGFGRAWALCSILLTKFPSNTIIRRVPFCLIFSFYEETPIFFLRIQLGYLVDGWIVVKSGRGPVIGNISCLRKL